MTMWADQQRTDGSFRKVRGDDKQSGQWTDPQGSTGLKYVDVTITAAQLKALNATPQTLVAAPGAGYAVVLDSILLHKQAGTAYAGIAAGEDLSVRYTDGSGTELTNIETTGFLDQTTVQTRFAERWRAASGVADITPANAAIVLHMLSGEITTGTGSLLARVYYRKLPLVLPSTL